MCGSIKLTLMRGKRKMKKQKDLSLMVILAAKEAGYTGVMALSVAVKKKVGLSQPRVSKVWNGNLDAKIGDYIMVMKFLKANFIVGG